MCSSTRTKVSRATRNAIDYREIEAVDAKGKAEPIPVWEAREARARFGVDVSHHARAELVGRERELSPFFGKCFWIARDIERIPQLVTLVAVPGMGKSRLVLRAPGRSSTPTRS